MLIASFGKETFAVQILFCFDFLPLVFKEFWLQIQLQRLKSLFLCMYFLNFQQTLVECSTLFNPAGLHQEPVVLC
jgi:hypothetical protein